MNLKTIKSVLKRDLWWNADKCLENGLVDEIHKGDFLNINLKNHFNQSLFDSNKVSEIQSKGKKNSIEDIKTSLLTISSSKRKRIDDILAEPDDSDSDSDKLDINKPKTKKTTKTTKRSKK
jgi:hypothetical protein